MSDSPGDGQGHNQGDDDRDDLLRKKDFNRAKGLDISSFMVGNNSQQDEAVGDEIVEAKVESVEQEEADYDVAVGDMAELFTKGGAESKEAGAIQRDGTVIAPPEDDSVQDLAVHGERQLSKGMMIALIIVWSAIGTIVGLTLDPILGAAGLLFMAGFGLYVGERWIPKSNMHLLGVTWVIISMKLLYGLAIDLHHWGWLDSFGYDASIILVAVLISLVGFNIYVAQRHDNDAIAAQATLVLLAIGTAAGGLYGEVGVALMIGLGTILFHTLAIHRNSGNLASLGIAVSYLWIGIHALSNGWSVFTIEILGFQDDLLLFLLIAGVTGMNAAMAAHFADKENWFSQGFNAVGLGKPGLWTVSVGLGMIGALMAIAAHRLETGYALAQLILLLTAFSASYLVVRGVEWKELVPFIVIPAPLLLILLSVLATGVIGIELPFGLKPYTIYAALSALLTSITLLKHQTAVSDHVLWIGGLVVVTLLTLLIPAQESEGARALLMSQGIVWAGLGFLGIKRDSPSISGIASLAPWLWLLLLATDARSRVISADILPVNIPEFDMAIWLVFLIVLSVGLNIFQGETGVNLAAKLVGLSEVGARVRDSGMMKLWNISFILAVVTIWAITRPGSLSYFGLFASMGLLILSHSILVYSGHHEGRPRTLLSIWAIFAIIHAWSNGFAAIWAFFTALSSALLLFSYDKKIRAGASDAEIEQMEANPGQTVTLMMGVVSMLFLSIALKPYNVGDLSGIENFFSSQANLLALCAVAYVVLILYLQRASTLEKLLPPVFSALGLIVTMGFAGQATDTGLVYTLTSVAFLGTSVWLVWQGDVRSGLKAVAKKETRLAEYQMKREAMAQFIEDSSVAVATTAGQTGQPSSTVASLNSKSGLKLLDTQLLHLSEKQKKRSKRSGVQGESDLLLGDIFYTPVVVLIVIAISTMASSWFSFATPNGNEVLMLSVFTSIIFIAIARYRAGVIRLRIQDFMGIELPIAAAMIGLVLIHLAGRVSDSVVTIEPVTHLLVLFIGLAVLSGLGLIGRSDLGMRIPSALEAVVFLFAIDRMLAVVVGGEVPIPMMSDPFAGELQSWTPSLFAIEAALLFAVWAFDWVESKRVAMDLSDHRGAAGRASWVVMVSVISLGPAAIYAIVNGIRRGWDWKQPGAVLVPWLLLGAAISALLYWLPIDFGIVIRGYHIGFIQAIISALVVAIIVRTRQGLWLSSALWSVELLAVISSFMYADLVVSVIALLLVSGITWVSGILTLRRGWRIVGGVNLAAAWLAAAVVIINGAGIMAILLMLVASAILLGIVTYLNQTYENELAVD